MLYFHSYQTSKNSFSAKPNITTKPPKSYIATKGDYIVLGCSADGLPKPEIMERKIIIEDNSKIKDMVEEYLKKNEKKNKITNFFIY